MLPSCNDAPLEQRQMSLRDEFMNLKEAVNISKARVEQQQTYLDQLRSRKLTLKSKHEELEKCLRQLLSKVEDKKKLRSDLLGIKNEFLEKSKVNLAGGKRLTSLQEHIENETRNLASKNEEYNNLLSDLERLKRQNNILKLEKEDIKKKISELAELKTRQSEKAKTADALREKNARVENDLKELDASIIRLLREMKSLSEEQPEEGDRSVRFPGSPPSAGRPETEPPADAEEEIFIMDPPFPSDVRNVKGTETSGRIVQNGFDERSAPRGPGVRPDLLQFGVVYDDNNNDDAGSNGDHRVESLERLLRKKSKGSTSNNYVEQPSSIGQTAGFGRDPVDDDGRALETAATSTGDDEKENDDPASDQKETGSTSDRAGSSPRGRPVRRHFSLGDAKDTVLFLPGKRWSHQVELSGGGGGGDRTGQRPLRKASALKGNLRRRRSGQDSGPPAPADKRVTFDPLTLLFNAAVEGELNVVSDAVDKLGDWNASKGDGMTALHYAIFAEHFHVVVFLVEGGCDVNAPDVDGWTPLHCAASCNDLRVCEFLVESGASIFATSYDDEELPSDKCDEMEPGFSQTREYLTRVEDELGIASNGVVYALYDYAAESPDELSFRTGDGLIILKKGDEQEGDCWWWGYLEGSEGYIPRNLIGMYPRVMPTKRKT